MRANGKIADQGVFSGLHIRRAIVLEIQFVGITEVGSRLAGGDGRLGQQGVPGSALAGIDADGSVGAGACPKDGLGRKDMSKRKAKKQ